MYKYTVHTHYGLYIELCRPHCQSPYHYLLIFLSHRQFARFYVSLAGMVHDIELQVYSLVSNMHVTFGRWSYTVCTCTCISGGSDWYYIYRCMTLNVSTTWQCYVVTVDSCAIQHTIFSCAIYFPFAIFASDTM